MKKRIKNLFIILILILSCLSFTSCSKTNNEIYNTSYTGTISLDDFESAVQSVISLTQKSVIAVTNYAQTFGGIELQSIGSAVIYEGSATLKDGSNVSLEESINRTDVKSYTYHAITNEHVVEDAYILRVYYNEEEIKADVLTSDNEVDLALIEFETEYYISPLTLGDSEQLVAGSFVLAIGCPEGLEYYGSTTFGIVSSAKRYIDEVVGIKKVTNEYIQHDATINSGNSGGPLINMKGEVIGINTWKMTGESVEGMGFAIPSNVVKEYIESYVSEEE